MKKIVVIICFVFSIVGCNNNAIPKPDNLIEKDKMVSILYDISLLEAIKNQNINGGISTKMSNEYIYKKYKIDSAQFAKSNKYYASDIEGYKKMFEEVKAKLSKETIKIEKEMKKNGQEVPSTTPTPVNPDVPQIQ